MGELLYSSTRGGESGCTASEAVLKGLAKDGGLFMPERIPRFDFALPELKDASYQEVAYRVMRLLLTDYSEEELRACIEGAYDEKFDTPEIAPLTFADDAYYLELFHGKTIAFKDMALSILPYLMTTAAKKNGVTNKIEILTATSGDTGKAAMAGFADVPGTGIVVFYPKGGVSRFQELQMLTQKGDNTAVVSIEGNFDDAQTAVKQIFGDRAFEAELAAKKVQLSSANSINIGRLVPQIVYYFSAYADLLAAQKIQAGDTVNFTVPTGNFGNILAGYYAKRMGLPVGKLVCASNENNVLTDFLRRGIYDRRRPFYQTMSPSMDILISSNLERLLYHLTEDTAQVAAWMRSLTEEGSYDASMILSALRENFWAAFTSDMMTEEEIRIVYERTSYTLDTHTAVAYRVAEDYRRETGDLRPMIVLSTASPYKFGASVLQALGKDTDGLDEFTLMERLQKHSGMPIPTRLAALRTAPVRHEEICEKDGMRDAVLDFARR